MPIKLPKGFARRQSSANVTEEVENTRQPSFRVINRHNTDEGTGSYNGGLAQEKVNAADHHPSTTQDQKDTFANGNNAPPFLKTRGSGGTDRSVSTGRMYESSSSPRYSSSSTLPSSADVPVHDNNSHSRNPNDTHVTPLGGALRAAGRTFSFGGRMSKNNARPQSSQQNSTPQQSSLRSSRPLTASTASTATPPKLPDGKFGDGKLGGDDGDDFGNMFENFGKQDSNISHEKKEHVDLYPPSPLNNPSTDSQKKGKEPQMAPVESEVGPVRHSWSSRHSEEGLLSTSLDAGHENQDDFVPNGLNQSRTMPLTDWGDKSRPIPTTSHRSLEKPLRGPGNSLRRSLVWSEKQDHSAIDDDADAKLVRQSLLWNKNDPHASLNADRESGDMSGEEPLFGDGDGSVKQSGVLESNSTPRPGYSPESTDSPVKFSIGENARLAAQYEESAPKSASPSKKVMTPSQFEHYRQQQELRRTNSDASKSDDESDQSDFDEEDEAERNREAERQRRKQEARLAIYRQQMTKVTGQPPESHLSLRPEMGGSAPNLTPPPASNSGTRSGSGKSDDADEDEEIPLGILAAHGFPNRNRPPSRLVSSASIPNLRASVQQPPYVSSSGSPSADQSHTGNRESLPVFAKNLPRDPYFGASLVNTSNRESLAMGGGAPVQYGGPSASSSSSALHSAGLIGVIATEERARAIRRGSPNVPAGPEHQLGGMPPTPGGVPRPYSTMNMNMNNNNNMPNGPVIHPVPSAAEQAQIQLSQQMSSVVQMQMQLMQQMMQMQQGGAQGMQGSHRLPTLKNFPLHPPSMGANPNVRPVTMHSAGGFMNPHASAGAPPAPTDPRTLSMINPMPFNPVTNNRQSTSVGNAYAPSITPSERSNIGLSPRYRPVSTAQPEQGFNNNNNINNNKRSSTFTSSTLKPWDSGNNQRLSASNVLSPSRPRPEKEAGPGQTEASGAIMTDHEQLAASPVNNNTNGKPAHSTGSDDEDDEKAWAEMTKKREKKKNSWKMKKETANMSDLLSAVH